MKKPCAGLVRAVWDHARRIHSHGEHQYARFMQEARNALADRANDPQFAYILRRIWMRAEVEEQGFWEHFIAPTLRAEYEGIDLSMDWTGETSTGASWITPQLVQRTLSLWQPKLPVSLGVHHATKMLRATGRLLDFGVRA